MSVHRVDHTFDPARSDNVIPSSDQVHSLAIDENRRCDVCGSVLQLGDQVWHWQVEVVWAAHTWCLWRHAPGIILDMVKVLR